MSPSRWWPRAVLVPLAALALAGPAFADEVACTPHLAFGRFGDTSPEIASLHTERPEESISLVDLETGRYFEERVGSAALYLDSGTYTIVLRNDESEMSEWAGVDPQSGSVLRIRVWLSPSGRRLSFVRVDRLGTISTGSCAPRTPR